MIDTAAYTKELEAAGFSREQAEALAKMQQRVLKSAIEQARTLETKNSIEQVLSKTQRARKQDMNEFELSIIKWLCGIFAAQTVILTSIIHLLLK